MDNQLLSERIKQARENIGITKAEASRRLNLSKIGYCRYEYGDRTPSVQTLEVIARCFNTSVDFLTGKTDSILPDQIIVSKTDSPELFEFVSTLQDSDTQLVNRLLAYYKEISMFKETDSK